MPFCRFLVPLIACLNISFCFFTAFNCEASSSVFPETGPPIVTRDENVLLDEILSYVYESDHRKKYIRLYDL